MKIRSLEEPKLEPERIRSFKFCQPSQFLTRQTGFIQTLNHATVTKCINVDLSTTILYNNLQKFYNWIEWNLNYKFFGTKVQVV
jgi:hypothetical protein